MINNYLADGPVTVLGCASFCPRGNTEGVWLSVSCLTTKVFFSFFEGVGGIFCTGVEAAFFTSAGVVYVAL